MLLGLRRVTFIPGRGAIVEHRTAWLPIAGASTNNGGSQYVARSALILLVFLAGGVIRKGRHVSCMSAAKCASRVPTEIFSAGPREAIQAPYRAGHTAG
jgi:hypothetical protein